MSRTEIKVDQPKEQEDGRTALHQTAGIKVAMAAPVPARRDRPWLDVHYLVHPRE